jgi:hypothetical protein
VHRAAIAAAAEPGQVDCRAAEDVSGWRLTGINSQSFF